MFSVHIGKRHRRTAHNSEPIGAKPPSRRLAPISSGYVYISVLVFIGTRMYASWNTYL